MSIDIGLEEGARAETAKGLAKLLADTYTLYITTQGFHWNVTGPSFDMLHRMFERQYEDLAEALDGIAERMRALGHRTPGSFIEISRLTSLSESSDLPAAEEMVRRLLRGHEGVIRTARGVLATAENARDAASADFVTQRLATHEKQAWMLRSTLG